MSKSRKSGSKQAKDPGLSGTRSVDGRVTGSGRSGAFKTFVVKDEGGGRGDRSQN